MVCRNSNRVHHDNIFEQTSAMSLDLLPKTYSKSIQLSNKSDIVSCVNDFEV